MNRNVVAIVAAAGAGKRFGSGANKIFHTLSGKPLIAWSLDILEDLSEINEIVPVLKEDGMLMAMELFGRRNFSKVRRIAPGGDERQDSIYHALKLINGRADIVVIHDGARPLIDRETVLKAIKSLEDVDGVIVAVPVKDTIKEAENTIVKETLKRETLWAAQTPQVFLYASIMKAYDEAMAENYYSTDDSALIERLGGKVKIVMGSYENIKVTTHEDILLAELLLKKRLMNI